MSWRFYTLHFVPITCVSVTLRMTLQPGDFRKGFDTLHKHSRRCFFYLQTNQKPVTPLCIFAVGAWLTHACVLPCVCRTVLWRRCRTLHLSQVLKALFGSGARLSSLRNCFTLYICMSIVERHLACKKAIRMQGCGSTGVVFLHWLDERWNLL